MGLSACATEDMIDGEGSGIVDGGTSMGMTSDGMTTDGMTSEGTSGAETEDTADEGGCNVESPYMGGWDIGCCQDEIVQNGWSPGGIVAGTILPDWIMTDQYGEDLRVYDFCHDAIYFEYAAVW